MITDADSCLHQESQVGVDHLCDHQASRREVVRRRGDFVEVEAGRGKAEEEKDWASDDLNLLGSPGSWM